MTKEQVMGIIRHTLTFVGGILITKVQSGQLLSKNQLRNPHHI